MKTGHAQLDLNSITWICCRHFGEKVVHQAV